MSEAEWQHCRIRTIDGFRCARLGEHREHEFLDESWRP